MRLILIADDEPMIRELAVRTLQAAGYRTLAAADGEEAVRIFASHMDAIAPVLLDGVMPKMNGPRPTAACRQSIRRFAPCSAVDTAWRPCRSTDGRGGAARDRQAIRS